MSSIPPGFARVPSLVFSRFALGGIHRSTAGLYALQQKMASGVAVERFSDDAVRAAALGVLDERVEIASQRLRNIETARGALDIADDALARASDLLLEAKSIAMTQSGSTSTPDERRAAAEVVDGLVNSFFGVLNTESIVGHVFGGAAPGRRPFESLHGGFRSISQGRGLFNDIGLDSSIPLTLGPAALGGTSARVEGTVDLNPALTAETRLVDLRGARGLGVTLGAIEASIDGGPRVRIDLSHADTAGDVARAIESALGLYARESETDVLDENGVSFQGGSFVVNVARDDDGFSPIVRFHDIGTGVTAADLGLTALDDDGFTDGETLGLDVQPLLTWRSRVSSLDGVTGDLGRIRVRHLGKSAVVDLASAATLDDLRNLVEGTGLGLRVEINADRTGINIISEVAAGRGQALAIEEVAGANQTATRLGVRSMAGSTSLAAFNDGDGVRIVNGSVDQNGNPDPGKDVDFLVVLGDGREIPVNLRPQDALTVGSVIARINQAAVDAGVGVPGAFEARLLEGANGIALVQGTGISGPVVVRQQNNSSAAFDLGLMNGTFDPATRTLLGEDRATVRPQSALSFLIDLRDSLRADDQSGIEFAAGRVEDAIQRVAQTRAVVGGYASRVESARQTQEERMLLDRTMRSQIGDLDFAEAAVRLSALQVQLQAAYQTTAMLSSRSLLDFLG